MGKTEKNLDNIGMTSEEVKEYAGKNSQSDKETLKKWVKQDLGAAIALLQMIMSEPEMFDFVVIKMKESIERYEANKKEKEKQTKLDV